MAPKVASDASIPWPALVKPAGADAASAISLKKTSVTKDLAVPVAQIAGKGKLLDPKSKKSSDASFEYVTFPGLAEINFGWPPVIPLLSCTQLSPQQEGRLHALLSLNRSIQESLRNSVCENGANRSNSTLDDAEKSLSSVLNEVEELLETCFIRAMLPLKFQQSDSFSQANSCITLSSLLANKTVVLITDPLLFALPLEGLSCFQNAASVSRDFSLHWMYRRIQSSSRSIDAASAAQQSKVTSKEKAAATSSKATKSSASSEPGSIIIGTNF